MLGQFPVADLDVAIDDRRAGGAFLASSLLAETGHLVEQVGGAHSASIPTHRGRCHVSG